MKVINRIYIVDYKMYEAAEVKEIKVNATSKEDAYDVAAYYEIPDKEDGDCAYAIWVDSVEYGNGNIHRFNTFEGKPY